MIAGAQNELVREAMGSSDCVQLLGAHVETVAVLIAAVEIEFQMGKALADVRREVSGLLASKYASLSAIAEGFLNTRA